QWTPTAWIEAAAYSRHGGVRSSSVGDKAYLFILTRPCELRVGAVFIFTYVQFASPPALVYDSIRSLENDKQFEGKGQEGEILEPVMSGYKSYNLYDPRFLHQGACEHQTTLMEVMLPFGVILAKMGRRQCKSAYNIIKNKTTPESSPPPTPKSDYCNADKAEENDLKKSLMKMLEEAFEEKMKNVSKEIGENTNKKLEEINKEIEEKKSKKLEEMNNEIEEKKNKKLEEMNNEIEEKKNKRVEEMNKEIEEKRNKKLQELDKEMEEKINKKLKEMNKEIEEKTNKKLEEINKLRLHKGFFRVKVGLSPTSPFGFGLRFTMNVWRCESNSSAILPSGSEHGSPILQSNVFAVVKISSAETRQSGDGSVLLRRRIRHFETFTDEKAKFSISKYMRQHSQESGDLFHPFSVPPPPLKTHQTFRSTVGLLICLVF
ncbi:hypothetical protein STEG23_021442, partial [Scotinomys teguina]